MSLFGWSLPPGCSTLPGEESAGPCELCGEDVDAEKCECPECPECGQCGCMKHISDGELISRIAIQGYLHHAAMKEWKRRKSQPCPDCKAELTPNPLDDEPSPCVCGWMSEEARAYHKIMGF